MVFVTAAFGRRYHRFAEGFCRSFVTWMPTTRLVLFTDDASGVYPPGVDVRLRDYRIERASLPPFYHGGHAGSQRANVVKFRWLEEVGREPGVEQVTWSDVDALVLGDLHAVIEPGLFNFCRHGRLPTAADVGGGLRVEPADYAVGGLYSLPARSEVWDVLKSLIDERMSWRDTPSGQQWLGDQPMVNQIRARFLASARWIGAPGHYVSLDIGRWRYPVAGDPGVRRFKLRDGQVCTPDGLVMPYLVAVAKCWDDWMATGFADWDPEVAKSLRAYYPARQRHMARAARLAPWVVPVWWRMRRVREAARGVASRLLRG